MKKMILTFAAAIMILTATQAQTKFHKQINNPLALTESIVNGDYKLAKKCNKHVRKHEFKADTCFLQKLTETVRYNPNEFVKQEIEKEQKEFLNNINN